MQPKTQTTFSFLFFIGSVFVSIAVVQGGWSFDNVWGHQSSSSYDVPWVSQNFDLSANRYINKNITLGHQKASYQYLMMASYFSRADVALPGFAKYFRAASDRELANVDFLVNYINKRGGFAEFHDIEKPTVSRWSDGVDAMDDALKLEKELNRELLSLHVIATNKKDTHLKHTIEDKFLEQKVETIKQIGDHLSVLEKMKGEDYGLGEYVFDGKL